ncbi:MAG: inositol monophosphatase [Cyclobacteriaceae bacterium]
MNLAAVIEQAANVCVETGNFIRRESETFSKNDIEIKGKNDLVSYVDKQAEQQLVAGLSDLIPNCGFITEENTIAQKKETYTWIVDPLDGTTNFIHGLPAFAVSVGLLHDEELVGGIIYEVNREELFTAWKNGGSFLNGEKISVSNAEHIGDSLLATGFPYYNFEKLNQYLAILNELMKNTHGLRRIGSAAVDLAYVACGRFEGFFEYNLNPWDVAAGILIVKEAGGKVTDFSGGDNALFGRELVAAGPVHHELIQVIQEHW